MSSFSINNLFVSKLIIQNERPSGSNKNTEVEDKNVHIKEV